MVAQATVDYANAALEHLDVHLGTLTTRVLQRLQQQLAHYIPLVEHVIAQTDLRVLQGEPVPAPDKLVSIFEPHTDVIVKDRRETYYGHKIFLTSGASGLILDCAIPKGNPADSTWTLPMLQRQ